MAIKKTIEIDVDVVRANGGLENFTQNFEKNEKAAKSLKAELRELKEQLAQLPEGSDEYNKIAQRAGEVSDKIGDISTRVKALGSDTKVIDGVVQGAQTLSGAFTVASSASALLGNENEDLQETMLKVESAIGLTVGIQSISNALQKESALSILASNVATKIQIGLQVAYAAVVGTTTGALKALRVALVSTGVGALVVALGYLVSKMTESTEATADNEEALKSLTKAQKVYENSLRNNIYQIENSTKVRVLRAKIAGKSEKELRDIEKEGEKERADALDAEIKRMDKELENKKLSQAAYSKLIEDRNKLADESLKLAQDRDNAQLEFELGIEEKRRENESKANDELLEKQKKAKQERIDEFLRLKRAETDAANQAALDKEKTDTAFFDKEMEARKNNELSKMTEQEADLERVRLKYEADLAYAEQNGLDASALKESQENEINDINLKYQRIDYENKKAAADAEIKLEEEKQAAKQKALQAYSSGLKTAASLLGESTAAGKAMAVAAATIDTIQSGVSAYKGMVAAVPGPVGIALGAVAAAGSLASGYASVKKILAVKTPGGGGGGASAGAGGGAPAPPPQFNIVGQSSTNQLSQTIATQQNRPIQTYVVGNQVSTQQSLDRNAVATSTFG